jgi:hypothetical protein
MKIIKTSEYCIVAQNNIIEPQIVEGPQMMENQNLPVIGVDDLSSILEDDIEDISEVPPTIEEKPIEDKIQQGYPQFSTNNETLEWAEQNLEVIRISYVTKKGKNLIRNVEPHGQFYAKTTHHQIVVTFDRTINAIRAFIVRNIQKIDFTGEGKFNKKFIVSAR